MTTLQLVRGERYEVVPNPLDDSPAAFAHGDVMPVNLGSQDLVKIAIVLREISFTPVRISLVNRTFTPIDDDAYEGERSALLSLLRTSDERTITDFIWKDLSGIYIAALDFINTDQPIARITIRQKGVVNASNIETGTTLARILNSVKFNG